ncbi:MAG: hypothetical protein IJ150_13815, partial [Bacteroidales bacterium]|nr:hypothetical protein [Bacteroidales bacterium]
MPAIKSARIRTCAFDTFTNTQVNKKKTINKVNQLNKINNDLKTELKAIKRKGRLQKTQIKMPKL